MSPSSLGHYPVSVPLPTGWKAHAATRSPTLMVQGERGGGASYHQHQHKASTLFLIFSFCIDLFLNCPVLYTCVTMCCFVRFRCATTTMCSELVLVSMCVHLWMIGWPANCLGLTCEAVQPVLPISAWCSRLKN